MQYLIDPLPQLVSRSISLRLEGIRPITFAAAKKPLRPSKPQALMGKKPSKFALEGNKWAIVSLSHSMSHTFCDLFWRQEFQENESSLIVEDAQLNHSVNLFGCKKSTIEIKGKVNAVTLGVWSLGNMS